MTEKKNVYISLHEAFVREGIQYTDRATGEQRSFNVVRLPPDTVIEGRDVGGYEFLEVPGRALEGRAPARRPRGASEQVGPRRGRQAGRRRGREAGEGDRDGHSRADQGSALGGEEEVLRAERPRRQGPLRACGGREGRGGKHGEGRSRAPFRP